jgi:hypothetical protein
MDLNPRRHRQIAVGSELNLLVREIQLLRAGADVAVVAGVFGRGAVISAVSGR